MQLSVIIVNYNVRAFLENSLISVKKAMSSVTGEIIVVDNASDDGSVEMVRQKFPDVMLIESGKNVGFAAGNNMALRTSRGKYILLLNPDTIVQEDTFRVMIDFLEGHPDAGIAGCKILNPDGSLEPACRRSFPTPWAAFTKIMGLSALFPRSPFFGRYNLAYLDPEVTYEVDAVSGSFMFARRSILDEVGGLDEQFFMYGEDLDWCYRVKQAGWKVYYVHTTQIIHYKGESTRRSNVDEVKLFHEAMRVFVGKHFRHGFMTDALLRFGIALRQWVMFLIKIAKPLRAALFDFMLVDISLLLGEYIWVGSILRFPSYAIPVILTVPAIAVVGAMYFMGVYTKRRLSFTHATTSVLIGYIIISALTFFFKQYGFSRMIVVISGIINVIALPGWRVAERFMLRSPEHRRRSLFGRRTIIVGTQKSGQEVLRKLRARVDDGYEVVGFVDTSHRRVGEKIAGVEILGSIDNIGKVIQEHKASEVIFSTDILSYGDILSVIGRSRNRAVNFRLVPSSLEVIIGKTHIDELDDIPLVEIDYNIDRPLNRLLKRMFDVVCALVLLLTVYPLVVLKRRKGGDPGGGKILLLPKVLKGELSIVGPPELPAAQVPGGTGSRGAYWGRRGLTGIVQINDHEDLSPEEVEKYNLYYAKNQSLILDIQILLKSLAMLLNK